MPQSVNQSQFLRSYNSSERRNGGDCENEEDKEGEVVDAMDVWVEKMEQRKNRQEEGNNYNHAAPPIEVENVW